MCFFWPVFVGKCRPQADCDRLREILLVRVAKIEIQCCRSGSATFLVEMNPQDLG